MNIIILYNFSSLKSNHFSFYLVLVLTFILGLVLVLAN